MRAKTPEDYHALASARHGQMDQGISWHSGTQDPVALLEMRQRMGNPDSIEMVMPALSVRVMRHPRTRLSN